MNAHQAEEPQPREPLGHPMVSGAMGGASYHSPEFDDRAPESAEGGADETQMSAVVPPSSPDDVPRMALSEQVTRRLRGDDGDAR